VCLLHRFRGLKVDYPRIKDKNKESKIEANLAQVINTQSGSTSQVGGSDPDLTLFSFSVTTRTIGYSGEHKWMLDIETTYHICLNKDWFSNFEKLDGCYIVMSNNRPCNMEGIGTVLIKMFDGMVQELKEVRYVPQLKKNFISVGVLEALGLEIFDRDGVLKILRGSMVVLKGF